MTRKSQQIENAGLIFIVGFCVILLFQLLGEVTVRLLDFAIPGPVIGLVYLLIFLLLYRRTKGKDPQAIELVASNLLAHMSLLFVPAGVGLMVYIDKIVTQWQPIIIALVAASLVTLVVTAWGLKLLIFVFRLTEPE